MIKKIKLNLLPDKENVLSGNVLCKKSHDDSKLRNPLKTLTQNTRVEAIKNSLKRSSSTSCIEPERKITNSRRPSSTSTDEAFVDGTQHHINFMNIPPSSGITKLQWASDIQVPKVTPVVRLSGHGATMRKPSMKVTIRRKSSNAHIESDHQIFHDCLYNNEYFEDNFKYMLLAESGYIFRKDLLRKYSDHGARLTVVNWLVYIQQVISISDLTILTAVRMFDNLLIKFRIPPEQYILFGLTCVWLKNKLYDTNRIKISKLHALSSGKYSRDQFVNAEMEVLKVLDFKINYPEPSTFLYYYIEKLNHENKTIIYYAAMFVLEMFMLLLDYSASAPSLLAGTALKIVLVKLEIKDTFFSEFIHTHLMDSAVFRRYSQRLLELFNELLDKRQLYDNEIVAKYSMHERLCVAKYFL